ncbi:MAG: GNAT family N-acetyltransferase [Phenylobacterium sp.]|uniref:GNAT family N-acetyltransferase n=1 Tax=Phenylobacterium sp. TaxID=1871053 RepID=UPI00271F0101|nr:GNAT family N-acetyltransferase [Phenylobacterium sp.]MDO8910640.1 GNAT family N-acetyltransferase [Phenylobacterium sp.]MDP3102284.1 GNAT family N-acetyltransferase [Phenylobacterium sp.]
MLSAETFHPNDLPETDISTWRMLCASRPEFANPLMGPDFALAVGKVRPDARVTVWRWPGRTAGFLAYHRRPGSYARPIGAPLSDYHGLVAEQGLDADEAMAVAGLSVYRFTGLTDPNRAFAGGGVVQRESFVIELETTAEAYLEALRAASPKRFKNYRRLDHKLDREVGELSIRGADRDPAAFDTLLRWKREQLARTGAHGFLNADWTQGLLQSLFERQAGDFQGLMVNLYAGDRLVAGHFGVRQGGVYHPWIASTDPELAAWSPGQVFLGRAIAAMPEMGLTTYDLGPGHEHYKRPYALTTRMIGEGVATAANLGGRAAQVSEQAWSLAGAHGQGPVGRLRRRLDIIASSELSFTGRARGLAQAIAARTRRQSAEFEAV